MKNVGGYSHNAFWIRNMGRNQENGKEKYFKMKTLEIEKVVCLVFFLIISTWQFQDFAKI